jgi:hypothetical protein
LHLFYTAVNWFLEMQMNIGNSMFSCSQLGLETFNQLVVILSPLQWLPVPKSWIQESVIGVSIPAQMDTSTIIIVSPVKVE